LRRNDKLNFLAAWHTHLTTHHFFAPCPRGLEQPLVEELAELGIANAQATGGGVSFTGDWNACFTANRQSRIASRILWQIAHGKAADEHAVYALARTVDWPAHFDVARTIRVATTSLGATVRSLEFVSLKIKDAVCDVFRDKTGVRPSVDTQRPDIRIQCLLTATECTLYLDCSGEALFKRGWRHAGEAPLRENLAAGILRLAGWRPGIPLFDPMCGSGTFLIEAAQWAAGIAPSTQHPMATRFLLQAPPEPEIKLPIPHAGEQTKPPLPRAGEDWGEGTHPTPHTSIIAGSDVDRALVREASFNAQRAGLPDDAIEWETIDARDCDPPCTLAPGQPGIIVINPPYEERIQFARAPSAEAFYEFFAANMKHKFKGWTLYILSADMKLQQKLRLAPERRIPLYNGALECRLYKFTLR
jgi:putative N6-adenine-specific DNA methylase